MNEDIFKYHLIGLVIRIENVKIICIVACLGELGNWTFISSSLQVFPSASVHLN